VDDGTTLTARAYTRRKFLAFTAAGTAAAALAACGGSTSAPTDTPAPTKPAATTGPAPTATPVPQSLGVTQAAPTTAASSAAAAPATTAAGSAPAGTTGTTAAGTTSAAAQPTKPANLADKQTLRYADFEPQSFDPVIPSTPYSLPTVFEGLIYQDWTDNQLKPAYALSYQANSDATVWTFKLRPGSKWSDGSPLTAKDFEYTFKRIPDPKTASKYTAAAESLKNGVEIAAGKAPPDSLGVKALDDTTLECTLATATPFFPLLIATWSYLPTPKAVVDKSPDKWTEAATIVSTGPYILKEWKHDQSMAFEPNPNYWGGKPIITRVDMTIYEDPVAKGLAAYENNELDTAQVSSSDYDRVQKDAKLSKEMKGFPGSSTYFVHWDTTNKPTSDVKVRQALYLGWDRKGLIQDVLRNYYLEAPTILPPDIPGFNPAAALTGGIDKAKQLMSDAGFAGGQGWPSDFNIVYGTNATTKLFLEYLQSEWKKNLGITVNLQNLEAKAATEFRVSRKNQPFNGLFGNWGSDYGDPFNWHNFLFSSKNEFWPSHWNNPEFESIIDKAKGNPDKDARTKMYQDAEVILMREQAHMPIFHGQAFYVIKPNLQGIFHPAILGTVPRAKHAYWTK
jgi:oligopeptide transport system substrate-binding protein